ncbi:MAG: hypothetical protein JOY61_08230 [Chloroflexi bacterium]|nr:hypothetical protein [Chloroflexota bacterium]
MMTRVAAGTSSHDSALSSHSYDGFASATAMLTGATGFLYSLAFVVLRSDLLSAVFLVLTGLFGTATMVGIYARLKQTDETFAMLGLLLGVAGAMGAAIHGGYDLANALHPPATVNLDLPSQIDPRGMLTFGVAGLALWVIAWLMLRGGGFTRGLGYLGYLTAALLILIYLARLIVLDATSPLVLGPALLTGFVASPIWYIWLGVMLKKRPATR